MENKEEKTIKIRLDLGKELSRQFEIIKKNFGLKNNTETVRSLIRQEYNRIIRDRSIELQKEESKKELVDVLRKRTSNLDT
jgi:hypothetical protein